MGFLNKMRGKCTSPAWFTLIYKVIIPYDAFAEWDPHISFHVMLAIKIFACKYISEKCWLSAKILVTQHLYLDCLEICHILTVNT